MDYLSDQPPDILYLISSYLTLTDCRHLSCVNSFMNEKTAGNDAWFMYLLNERWISSSIAKTYSDCGSSSEACTWKQILQEFCLYDSQLSRTSCIKRRDPRHDRVDLADYFRIVDDEDRLMEQLIKPVIDNRFIRRCFVQFRFQAADRVARRFFSEPAFAGRSWEWYVDYDETVVELVALLLARENGCHVTSLEISSARFDFNSLCQVLRTSNPVSHIYIQDFRQGDQQVDLVQLPWSPRLKTLRLVHCGLNLGSDLSNLVAGLAANGPVPSLESLALVEPGPNGQGQGPAAVPGTTDLWTSLFNCLPNLKRLSLHRSVVMDDCYFPVVVQGWEASDSNFFVFDTAVVSDMLARVMMYLSDLKKKKQPLVGLRLKGLNRPTSCTPLSSEHTALFSSIVSVHGATLTTVCLAALGFPSHQEKIDGWTSLFQALSSSVPNLSFFSLAYCAEFINEAADSLCQLLQSAGRQFDTFLFLHNYVTNEALVKVFLSIPDSLSHVLLNYHNFQGTLTAVRDACRRAASQKFTLTRDHHLKRGCFVGDPNANNWAVAAYKESY